MYVPRLPNSLCQPLCQFSYASTHSFQRLYWIEHGIFCCLWYNIRRHSQSTVFTNFRQQQCRPDQKIYTSLFDWFIEWIWQCIVECLLYVQKGCYSYFHFFQKVGVLSIQMSLIKVSLMLSSSITFSRFINRNEIRLIDLSDLITGFVCPALRM